MRFACIGGNWTLCFYICVVYLFDSWFLYSVVSAKRMGMCSAYVLCPSTSRIIGDIIMPCINICFFYFLLICSVLFFMWVVPFHFFKKKILFFRAVLGSQQNRAESTVIFFHTLPAPHMPACTRVLHLLQLMNQQWHIIITQSPSVYTRVHSCYTFCGFWQTTWHEPTIIAT